MITQTLYAPSARRTRVLDPAHGQYAGQPYGSSFSAELAYLKWRITTVLWEDIDPDTEVLVPPKPVHHFFNRDEHPFNLAAFEFEFGPRPSWERPYWGTDEQLYHRQWQEALWEQEHVDEQVARLGLGYQLEDNFERMAQIEAQVRSYKIGKSTHWISGQDSVTLQNMAGDRKAIPVRRAMWMLQYGAVMPEDSIHVICKTEWCVRPEHLEAR